MIDLSLLMNHSTAAKKDEVAANLFAASADNAGKEAKGSNESFAQHMNRLKPPADEIHALLAQAKHSGADFPAAETVAESMVGAGYPQQIGKLEAGALQAKLQFGPGAAEGEAGVTEAGQPLTSEEISLLFQQMNLSDPVHESTRTGAGGSGNPTAAAGAQTLPSAAEIAQLAQDRLNGQRVAAESAVGNTQNGAPGLGNGGYPTTAAGAQTLPSAAELAQLSQNSLNGQRVATEGNTQNSAQANTAQASASNSIPLQPGELQAITRATQQMSGDQRQLNPTNLNPQQTGQLQSAQAGEALSRNHPTHQHRSSDTDWVRREIAIKSEIPLVKAGTDSLPETQFRTQVQAQQAMAAGGQQTPLPGADSTINSSSIQGSSHSADNQFNGLTQQLSSQPAQSTQQPGATASAQAMQYAQLSAQVGSQAWNQQLGQQLIQMAIHNQQSISLRLNPAELGQVLVNLQMDEHGAQLQLVSQNAQARAALEQALPQLRDSLAEQGIELGQSSVSDQEQQFGGREDNASHSFANSPDQSEQDGDAERITTAEAGIGPDGRVDLYA